MSKHKLNPRDGTEKAHWQKSYAANRVLIDQWNADPTNTCQLGETKWAHFTNAEFAALPQFNGRKNKQMYSTDVATANLRADRITTTLRPTGPTRLPTRIPTKAPVSSVPTVPTQAPVGPPPAFDWTTQTVNGAPVVGPIKDQGTY